MAHRTPQAPTSFSGHDIGNQIAYQNVQGSISNTYNFVPQGFSNEADAQYLRWLHSHRQELIDLLEFPELERRYAIIEPAHRQTCSWLLQSAEWEEWLDPGQQRHHHGLLWVKGKSGTGKSTIMKHVFTTLDQNSTDDIIIAFFFNARGSLLERSTNGMYRSLLVQLLRKAAHIEPGLPLIGKDQRRDGEWHAVELQRLLTECVEQLKNKSLTLFVDALDECDEDEIREMIRFLESLGATALSCNVSLRTCLSSRHYPHITIHYGLSMTLESLQEHTKDIQIFIDNELRIGVGARADRIRQELLRKSCGIFLWVRLVIPMINKEYDRGRVSEMERFLDKIPTQVEQLYAQLLEGTGFDGTDEDQMTETQLCLLLVLRAPPLTLKELYFAVRTGTNEQFAPTWNQEELSVQDMSRFILDCSRGLLEETAEADRQVVQFIHETVREFLLHIKKLIEGSKKPTALGNEVFGTQQLLNCCLKYVKRLDDETESLQKFRQIEQDSDEFDAKKAQVHHVLPFLEYAIGFGFEWLGERILPRDVTRGLLLDFPSRQWLFWKNYAVHTFALLPSHGDPQTGMLFVIAARGFETVAQIYIEDVIPAVQKRDLTIDIKKFVEKQRYSGGVGYLASYQIPSINCSTGIMLDDDLAKDAMLRVINAEESISWYFNTYWIKSMRQLQENLGYGSELETGIAEGIDLPQAVLSLQHCDLAAAKTRLEHNAVDVTFRNHGEHIAQMLIDNGIVTGTDTMPEPMSVVSSLNDLLLTASASLSCVTVVEKLLSILLPFGVDIIRDAGHTALIAACSENIMGSVSVLINAGLPLDSYCPIHGSALAAASRFGHERVVALLLQAGADVNAHCGPIGTALTSAFIDDSPNKTVISMLLEKGADIHAPSPLFGSPLEAAKRHLAADSDIWPMLGVTRDETKESDMALD